MKNDNPPNPTSVAVDSKASISKEKYLVHQKLKLWVSGDAFRCCLNSCPTQKGGIGDPQNGVYMAKNTANELSDDLFFLCLR